MYPHHTPVELLRNEYVEGQGGWSAGRGEEGGHRGPGGASSPRPYEPLRTGPLSTGSVLDAWGCHHKYHTLGGSNSRLYCLTVLKAGLLPPEGATLFHAPLLASGGCWQSVAFLGLRKHHPNLCLHLHVTFTPVCVSVARCPPFTRPPIMLY